MGESGTFAERLEIQADRLRVAGSLGRSDVLLRLFDFLVLQTLAGRAPKEIEIAQDVFGKQGGFDVMLDASVRVYIHRLRKKIDEFYAADLSGGERLYIPKGEYRLALADHVPDMPDAEIAPDPIATPRHAWRDRATRRNVVLAVVALLTLNVAVWVAVMRPWRSDPVRELANSDFWRPLSTNGRPTVLVTGDYYIFGEAPNSIEVSRLVREFAINSKDDLDQYLMTHPVAIGRYVDVGLHYLPTSVPQALRNVLPIVAEATGGDRGQELLIPMSQLTPDMLKKANIVYIGYLSGLGRLRDPLFEASGFTIGSSYDDLIDRRTGRHYVTDQGDVKDGRSPKRDFAYIASMPGPSGTRVLVVGGTRDAAVQQAAEIVSDAAQLRRIAAAAGTASGFEALYEVQTLDDLNLGSRLIIARGLPTQNAWKLDQLRHNVFPDQMPSPR